MLSKIISCHVCAVLVAVLVAVQVLASGGCSEQSGGRTTPDGGRLQPDTAISGDGPASDSVGSQPDTIQGADSGGNNDGWDGRYFPPGAIWYTDHSTAAVHPDSSAIINWLDSAGGWGNGKMQIDFSIEVLIADASAPMRAFTPTGEHYTPDCDIAEVPVPEGGALEGEQGYACSSDGDCHLIVVHLPSMKLFEMWRANISGGTFEGGCLAIWDMTRVYGPKGRGDQCTSADAAGFPIAPLLFSADEVAAGSIDHAIRFILPNARIRQAMYVRPATHGIQSTSGGDSAPPYGTHLRLKADVDISGLTPGAQVVAQALKKYGMFHADGGTIALTAQSDRFTQAKWQGLLGPHDLAALQVTDFEVIDHGEPIPVTYDCVREN